LLLVFSNAIVPTSTKTFFFAIVFLICVIFAYYSYSFPF
jgi:hypothetical protein